MKDKLTILALTLMTVFLLSNTCSAADLNDMTREIANDANNALNISNSDDTLLITNAGSFRYANKTTEESVQVIMNTVPSIKYSKILQLNRPYDDPTFIFAVKNNRGYYAKKYTVLQSGALSVTPALYIGPDMTETQFQKAKSAFGFDTLTLLSAWAAGAPHDMLKVAAWTGSVNPGLIGAYSSSKNFMANYPLKSNTESYHVITSAGGGDDDVPMFFMDSTPLKWSSYGKETYYNFRSAYTDDPAENIYIWWNADSKTGNMLYWTLPARFNRQLTGKLSELKENAELIALLNTNPAALYKVLKSTVISYDDLMHLWNSGIDRDYIANIKGASAPWINYSVIPENDYNAMYRKGVEAVQMANDALKAAGMLPLGKGDLVITSAGYSQLSGLSAAAIDGIASASGIEFKDIYSLKRGAQTPLWFVFVKRPVNNDGPLYAVFIDENGNLKPVVYQGVSYNVFDISAKNLEGEKGTAGYEKSLAVAEAYGYNIPQYANQDYYIVSLANQWAVGMPYDFMLSAIGGGCPGSGLTQGYLLATVIQRLLPLSGDQYYIYIGIPAHCKEQALMEVLGLSAGRGNYFTTGTRTSSDPNALGIAIRWDPAKNTGKAVLFHYDKNIINSIQPASNSYYKTMYWALWYIKYAFPGKEAYEIASSAFSIAKSATLTFREYTSLLAAGDPVTYIMEFTDITPPEVQVRISDSTLYMDINEDGMVFYSPDGKTWMEYLVPVRLDKKTTTIYYYAVDAAGNSLGIQKLTVEPSTVPGHNVETGPSATVEPSTVPGHNVETGPSEGGRGLVSTSGAVRQTSEGRGDLVSALDGKPQSKVDTVIYAILTLLVILGGVGLYVKRSKFSDIKRTLEHGHHGK